MNQQLQERATTSTKWAPWWLYLVIILGANSLGERYSPTEAHPRARVVIALGVAAALFVAITIIYRATARRDGTRNS